MSDEELTFVVHGEPVAQPRQRMGKKFGTSKTVSYLPDDHPVFPWKGQIIVAARRAVPENWDKAAAMQLSILFILPIDPRLKIASEKPTKRVPAFGPRSYIGDVDNYTKAVMDALNGIVWNDDVQVWGLWVKKIYCGPDDKPKAVVKILSGVDESEIP